MFSSISGPVSDYEHLSFLLYWLCQFLLSVSSLQVSCDYLFLAKLLAGGRKVALGQTFLAHLYRGLLVFVTSLSLLLVPYGSSPCGFLCTSGSFSLPLNRLLQINLCALCFLRLIPSSTSCVISSLNFPILLHDRIEEPFRSPLYLFGSSYRSSLGGSTF